MKRLCLLLVAGLMIVQSGFADDSDYRAMTFSSSSSFNSWVVNDVCKGEGILEIISTHFSSSYNQRSSRDDSLLVAFYKCVPVESD